MTDTRVASRLIAAALLVLLAGALVAACIYWTGRP